MRWVCLDGYTSIFPDQGKGTHVSPTTVCCSLRTLSNHRTSYPDFDTDDFTSNLASNNIWRASTLNMRNPDKVAPRGAKRVGEGRRAPSVFDGGDSHTGGDKLGAVKRPVRKGAARVGKCCSGRHRE